MSRFSSSVINYVQCVFFKHLPVLFWETFVLHCFMVWKSNVAPSLYFIFCSILRQFNLLNSECKHLLITLCVSVISHVYRRPFLLVDRVGALPVPGGHQPDFNLLSVPISWNQLSHFNPFHGAPVKGYFMSRKRDWGFSK